MSLVECVADERISNKRIEQIRTCVLSMRDLYAQLVGYCIMNLTDNEKKWIRNHHELGPILENAEEELMYEHYAA